MTKEILRFFDKLEDKVRAALSRQPIFYALVGGVGIVLFWKGVWEIAESFSILHGAGSVVLGVIILLMTGLLVSFFIGDSIILSGYKREKKLAEKTEKEVRDEKSTEERILARLDVIEKEIEEHPQGHPK